MAITSDHAYRWGRWRDVDAREREREPSSKRAGCGLPIWRDGRQKVYCDDSVMVDASHDFFFTQPEDS